MEKKKKEKTKISVCTGYDVPVYIAFLPEYGPTVRGTVTAIDVRQKKGGMPLRKGLFVDSLEYPIVWGRRHHSPRVLCVMTADEKRIDVTENIKMSYGPAM